jgi:hypothetical protein
MARKKIRNGKTVQFDIRCTVEERAAWKKAAKCAGLKTSAWFRERANMPANSAADPPGGAAITEALHQFASVLAWISNFATVLRLKGVNTSALEGALAAQRQKEARHDAHAEAIREHGSRLVRAANLGADLDTLQAIADDLLKHLSGNEQ